MAFHFGGCEHMEFYGIFSTWSSVQKVDAVIIAQTIYFPLVHRKIEFPSSSGKTAYCCYLINLNFPEGRSA